MLSAETAAGDYPVETVLSMAKTDRCGAVEQAQALGARVEAQYGRRDEAIALGAMYIANHLKKLARLCVASTAGPRLWVSRSGASLRCCTRCDPKPWLACRYLGCDAFGFRPTH